MAAAPGILSALPVTCHAMQFTIASDHPCLPGHFPGHPLVPGVVVLEQVILAIQQQTGLHARALRLGQVKFMGPLLPDQTATIALEHLPPRWRFTVSRGDEVLVRGEMQVVSGAVAAA
jgi:3-hydroxyacyl-[acyl-carrier-protein] dehydratase